MARPADPRRRAKTLAAAADYVLEHGLAGVSLRPLASALGTSTRMLLYDFASKEGAHHGGARRGPAPGGRMLAEHLSTTGASGPELLRAVWDWAGHADRAPFMRLFFEVYIDAMAHPDARSERAQAMVTEWLEQFGAALGRPPADAGRQCRCHPGDRRLARAAPRPAQHRRRESAPTAPSNGSPSSSPGKDSLIPQGEAAYDVRRILDKPERTRDGDVHGYALEPLPQPECSTRRTNRAGAVLNYTESPSSSCSSSPVPGKAPRGSEHDKRHDRLF